MATEIEGIYKNGKISPLEVIRLEENTRVVIRIINKADTKKKHVSLAGAWKDYKTADGKGIEWLKKEIYKSRKVSNRKPIAL